MQLMKVTLLPSDLLPELQGDARIVIADNDDRSHHRPKVAVACSIEGSNAEEMKSADRKPGPPRSLPQRQNFVGQAGVLDDDAFWGSG